MSASTAYTCFKKCTQVPSLRTAVWEGGEVRVGRAPNPRSPNSSLWLDLPPLPSLRLVLPLQLVVGSEFITASSCHDTFHFVRGATHFQSFLVLLITSYSGVGVNSSQRHVAITPFISCVSLSTSTFGQSHDTFHALLHGFLWSVRASKGKGKRIRARARERERKRERQNTSRTSTGCKETKRSSTRGTKTSDKQQAELQGEGHRCRNRALRRYEFRHCRDSMLERTAGTG